MDSKQLLARLETLICDDKLEEVKTFLQETNSEKLIIKDEKFVNPLHLAASFKRVQIMKLLLETCDHLFIETYINAFNGEGKTPLMYCFPSPDRDEEGKCKDLIKTLLEYGADPHLQIDEKESFLTRALRYWDMELIKVTLPYADINFIDKNKKNILFHVLDHYNKSKKPQLVKLIQLLQDYGLNIQHKNIQFYMQNNKTDFDEAAFKDISDEVFQNKFPCKHRIKIIMLGDENAKDYVKAIFDPKKPNPSTTLPWKIDKNKDLESIDLSILYVNCHNGTELSIWNIPQASIYQEIHKQLFNLNHSLVMFLYNLNGPTANDMLSSWLEFASICKKYDDQNFIGFCFVALGENIKDNNHNILQNEKISNLVKNFEVCDITSFVITKNINCVGFRKLRSFLLKLASTQANCSILSLSEEESASNNEVKQDILNSRKNYDWKQIKAMYCELQKYNEKKLKHAIEQLCETGQILTIMNYQNENYHSIILNPQRFIMVLRNIFQSSDLKSVDIKDLIFFKAMGIGHTSLDHFQIEAKCNCLKIENLPKNAENLLAKTLNCLVGKKYGYEHLAEAFNSKNKFENIEDLLCCYKSEKIQMLIKNLREKDMGMLAKKIEFMCK